MKIEPVYIAVAAVSLDEKIKARMKLITVKKLNDRVTLLLHYQIQAYHPSQRW